MPTVDGYEFVRRVRLIPEIAATLVIFYSAAYHEREARTLAARCGVVDILTKPSEPTVILAKIEAVLAGSGALLEEVPRDLHLFERDHLQLVTSVFAAKYSESEAREQRMAAIVEAAHQIASEHDPHVLLDKVCAAALDTMLAQAAVLGILRGDRVTTEMLFTSGLDDGGISVMTLPSFCGTPLSAPS